MRRWQPFYNSGSGHGPHLQAATVKVALRCLGQVLCAMEPSNWPAAAAPWALLLSFATDTRPKVRKCAVGSAQEVLGSVQRTAAHKPASEAITACEWWPGMQGVRCMEHPCLFTACQGDCIVHL